MTTRAATHSNSWYSGDKDTLDAQLDGWLEAVPSEIPDIGELPHPGARIIIAPHAGYSYSGPATAWAYKSLDISQVKRIFILGPSHHLYLDSCALSACEFYSTPLGKLTLDTEVLSALHANPTEKFPYMSLEADEEEHSIEMHLPYVYKLLSMANKTSSVKIVPIMVGAISTRKEKVYGAVLAPYLQDPTNLFIVSSDFCHWGSRFSYTHYYTALPCGINAPSVSLTPRSKTGPHRIYESIEALDRLGMAAIETGEHNRFADYLKCTHNTICGRHPIGVMMAALELVGAQGNFKFVRYEQSSRVREPHDSSVSYASAFAVV